MDIGEALAKLLSYMAPVVKKLDAILGDFRAQEEEPRTVFLSISVNAQSPPIQRQFDSALKMLMLVNDGVATVEFRIPMQTGIWSELRRGEVYQVTLRKAKIKDIAFRQQAAGAAVGVRVYGIY